MGNIDPHVRSLIKEAASELDRLEKLEVQAAKNLKRYGMDVTPGVRDSIAAKVELAVTKLIEHSQGAGTKS